MRGLHKWVVLLIWFAVPAWGFSPILAPGWASGREDLRSIFYPPIEASPRHNDSGEYFFAKEIWVDDAVNALRERFFYMYGGDDGAILTNALLLRWENEALQFLKDEAYQMMTESRWINLSHRGSDKTYNNFYAAFTNVPANPDEWLPPRFNETTVLTYANLPTNFWSYTPVRFLGATDIAFTNQNTQAGFDTSDYGWQAFFRLLDAMQDLSYEVGHYEVVLETENIGIEPCLQQPLISTITTSKLTVASGIFSPSYVKLGDTQDSEWTYDTGVLIESGPASEKKDSMQAGILRFQDGAIDYVMAFLTNGSLFLQYTAETKTAFAGLARFLVEAGEFSSDPAQREAQIAQFEGQFGFVEWYVDPNNECDGPGVAIFEFNPDESPDPEFVGWELSGSITRQNLPQFPEVHTNVQVWPFGTVFVAAPPEPVPGSPFGFVDVSCNFILDFDSANFWFDFCQNQFDEIYPEFFIGILDPNTNEPVSAGDASQIISALTQAKIIDIETGGLNPEYDNEDAKTISEWCEEFEGDCEALDNLPFADSTIKQGLSGFWFYSGFLLQSVFVNPYYDVGVQPVDGYYQDYVTVGIWRPQMTYDTSQILP